ncbi:hypothetical protein INT47_002080 [Mucor saturninus]|uniref:BZIP domain-containing protein n=1 Tax=Mucor saturninus TaxID=64648 RepID=A0A8H7R3J1_9FUNG|nr:hypothetical protein INT47_002080 [Mucor saturninus]
MNNLERSESLSKAGRHRIYTNEQRKDRNRKAQAAFRDRRNNYTKTLEDVLLKYEDKIQDLEDLHTASIQQVKVTEERCQWLGNELASVQKLLQLALAENQRLLQNTMETLPVSPPSCASDLHITTFLSNLNEPQDVYGKRWLEDLNYNTGEFIKN